MSQEDTQIAFEYMDPLELEDLELVEEWASQEDLDCPQCTRRYYLCVCHRLKCDCYKCQEVD